MPTMTTLQIAQAKERFDEPRLLSQTLQSQGHKIKRRDALEQVCAQDYRLAHDDQTFSCGIPEQTDRRMAGVKSVQTRQFKGMFDRLPPT